MFPVNIGIDFGTSFSKMCVRGPQSVGAAVCTFGDNLPSDALIPSKFWVDEDGNVSFPWISDGGAEDALVEYPKMALADLRDLKITGGSASLGERVGSAMEPLCALFVAQLLRMSKGWPDSMMR